MVDTLVRLRVFVKARDFGHAFFNAVTPFEIRYHPGPERELAESVAVWDMADLSKPKKVINVAKDSGLPATKAIRRAVHPEYSADGSEVWISLWGGKTDQSAIVVYDDKTLALKKVITAPKMITPTGKFNVYNTQHDIY